VATGVEPRVGKFEAAHQGTLFLDEVGDLNLAAQAKLLRALQERVIERVGGRRTIPVDVRVLAATNKDLEAANKAGTFRADLYYRLNVVQIRMPPLREIPQDIPLLANGFLAEHCREMNRPPPELASEVVACLVSYRWPGNVRELDNEMKRLAVTVRRARIAVPDLSESLRAAGDLPSTACGTHSLKQAVEAPDRRRPGRLPAQPAAGGPRPGPEPPGPDQEDEAPRHCRAAPRRGLTSPLAPRGGKAPPATESRLHLNVTGCWTQLDEVPQVCCASIVASIRSGISRDHPTARVARRHPTRSWRLVA
jgi:DNA-binding NtrC family response regulator